MQWMVSSLQTHIDLVVHRQVLLLTHLLYVSIAYVSAYIRAMISLSECIYSDDNELYFSLYQCNSPRLVTILCL